MRNPSPPSETDGNTRFPGFQGSSPNGRRGPPGKLGVEQDEGVLKGLHEKVKWINEKVLPPDVKLKPYLDRSDLTRSNEYRGAEAVGCRVDTNPERIVRR